MILKLNSIAVADRNSEEMAKWSILQAYQNLAECSTPENFTLPSYANVDTSPEESSQERSESHDKMKKRRRLKYVDDRAAVGESDEENSSIETDSDEIFHPTISLSTSSCDE